MVLAPEHALVEKLTTAENLAAVTAYQKAARYKSDLERTELTKEKSGAFTGAYAINPVTGTTIPVWIADYVLATYGTGAIMAVPAHDQRDFEFASKFGLPIKTVVKSLSGPEPEPGKAFCDEGVAVNSGEFDGHTTAQVKQKITVQLEARGQGKGTISYRLRDWVFSRQRYWGEPFPIVHCPTHGAVPLPESMLPVTLPEVERYEPTGTGESPLAGIPDWVNTTCPTCGGPAKRETNTMPQWAGSCWYYLRYIDPKNDQAPWSTEAEKQWQPVDLYIGGAEHAVLHLLYARFWHKVLYDLGFVSTKEPFKKLRHQGTVLSFSYQDSLGKYHEFSEVELRADEAFLKTTGEKLKVTVEKMAKSMLNGISPDDVVQSHGADVLRLYEMFMGDFELPKPWDPRAMEGMTRFLRRVWRMIEEIDPTKPSTSDPHLRLRHKTIKRVTQDLEAMAFNTAIAAMMEYNNELTSKGATREDLLAMVKMLGPYCPHFADEAWEKLGETGFVIDVAWPTWDEALTIDDEVTLAIQINGKLRGDMTLSRSLPEEEVKARVLALPSIVKHLDGKTIRKVIVVPGRIVNIVAS
jgi:leucyl-tRNA synthetase